MMTRWRIALAVVVAVTLGALAVPQVAFAGGGFIGGGQNRGATGGVCKSGKHVKNTKTCKENGGKH